jgi:hypothetical protein
MRSAIVILILCILVLLAFSSVWYPSVTGEDEDISDKPLDASRLVVPSGPRCKGCGDFDFLRYG